MTDASTPLTSRRSVLAAAGAVSLATTLTACSDSDDGSGYGDSGSADQQSGQSGQDQSDEAGGGDGGQELAQASEIPEGGGAVFKDQKVVVTQPNPGEYKAFSAVCTHRGCLVGSVTDGAIVCSCHNSRFSIADGSVQGGPATQPLAQANVSVEGGSVRLG